MPTALTLQPTLRGSLRVYPIDFALELGVDAFVTDRSGGVSNAPYDSLNLALHVGDDATKVAENRRRVARACGVSPEKLITVRQVHGRDVIEVPGPLDGVEADGLVSSSSHVALAILVADCLPVLLVDDASSRFGVVHAGWRGLRDGVLRSAVRRFANANTLHAFVGPSISVARYQVGPEVAEHFIHVTDAVVTDGGDRSRLDLRRVAVAQLNSLGLRDEHVVVSRETTDEGTPFFSDRADRPCGRFALVAKRAS